MALAGRSVLTKNSLDILEREKRCRESHPGVQRDFYVDVVERGIDAERHNLLHPEAKPTLSFVEQSLAKAEGPVIASTDYMRSFADQIRPFVPNRFVTLGTDGYGRSDSREALRSFFEVDRYYVVLAALKALADEGTLPAAKASEAIKKYNIDITRANPATI